MRFFTLLAALLLFPVISSSALQPVTAEHHQALKIKEAIFHRQYEKAQTLVSELKLPSSSPLPSLVNMTILELKMSENLNFTNGAPFEMESATNERKCEPILKNENSDVWLLMVCGCADTLRSLYFVKSGQTMKAFNVASRALRTFETVKRKDPDNIDVELAEAMYKYFKSEFTETKLSFLPFFKDHRGEALSTIRDVSMNGVFAKDLADFAMGIIAVETTIKGWGDLVFHKLTNTFPENVLFKIMQSASLIKTKEYRKAITVLEELQKNNPEITAAKYFMGRALALEGQNLPEAKKWLTEYIQTSPDPSVKGPSYYLLGLVAEKEGNIDDAMKYYKMGHEIYPKYKASLKNLMRLKRTQKA